MPAAESLLAPRPSRSTAVGGVVVVSPSFFGYEHDIVEAFRAERADVQLLAPDSPPPDVRQVRGHPLTTSGVAGILERVRTPTMGAQDRDDFRISLAGVQEKIAFLRDGTRWMIPEGTTPTTHIFKRPLGELPNGIDMTDSVENEHLCLTLARFMGFDAARTSIETFEDQPALIVERFDRRSRPDGGHSRHLPRRLGRRGKHRLVSAHDGGRCRRHRPGDPFPSRRPHLAGPAR